MLESQLFGSRTLDAGSFLGRRGLRAMWRAAAKCAAAAASADADASATHNGEKFCAVAIANLKPHSCPRGGTCNSATSVRLCSLLVSEPGRFVFLGIFANNQELLSSPGTANVMRTQAQVLSYREN